MEIRKGYAQDRGRCIYCNEPVRANEKLEITNGTVFLHRRCKKCGMKWIDHFRFVVSTDEELEEHIYRTYRDAEPQPGVDMFLETITKQRPGRPANPDGLGQSGASTVPGRWSTKYDACIQCGKTEAKHFTGGVCIACYRLRYARTPKKPKEVKPLLAE